VIYGNLALALNEEATAAAAFGRALAWAGREGAPIIAGRCHLGLAELEHRCADIIGALLHLDQAAALFKEHGARLYLDQVIAKKVELQGLSGSDPYSSIVAVSRAVQAEQPEVADAAAPDGTVTLMFSDIEGSTALNERLGDARWMEVLRAHNALIDEQVRRYNGRVVKTIGDGYMVVFASPEAAVRCALAIQSALENPPERLRDIRVRIGLHTGAAVPDGSDFFGREVNYAARVASAALGGEVLVSAALRERLGGGFALGAGREVEMKGFAGSQHVWQLAVSA
jgi:class 3 adenylate cyclase